MASTWASCTGFLFRTIDLISFPAILPESRSLISVGWLSGIRT